MKKVVLGFALLCLGYALYASWAHAQGWLARDVFLRQFSFASLGWFVSASWWAYRK